MYLSLADIPHIFCQNLSTFSFKMAKGGMNGPISYKIHVSILRVPQLET